MSGSASSAGVEHMSTSLTGSFLGPCVMGSRASLEPLPPQMRMAPVNAVATATDTPQVRPRMRARRSSACTRLHFRLPGLMWQSAYKPQ